MSTAATSSTSVSENTSTPVNNHMSKQNLPSKISSTGVKIHTELINDTPTGIPEHSRTKKILVKKKPVSKDYKPLFWLSGHCITLLFGFFYLGCHIILFGRHKGLVVRFFYVTAILGVLDSYAVSILINFGSSGLNFFALITTENFQYLLLAVIWLFSRPSVFKILPYVIISFLQLSKHFNKLGKIPKSVIKSLTLVISYNELVLILGLFLDTLLLRGTSGYSLAAFLGFYWLRIINSESTKFFFYNFTDVVEQRIISKYCPKNVQSMYNQFIASARLRGEEVEKLFHSIHQEEKQKKKVTAEKLEKMELKGAAAKEEEKDKGFDTKKNVPRGGDVKISAGEIPPDSPDDKEKKRR